MEGIWIGLLGLLTCWGKYQFRAKTITSVVKNENRVMIFLGNHHYKLFKTHSSWRLLFLKGIFLRTATWRLYKATQPTFCFFVWDVLVCSLSFWVAWEVTSSWRFGRCLGGLKLFPRAVVACMGCFWGKALPGAWNSTHSQLRKHIFDGGFPTRIFSQHHA